MAHIALFTRAYVYMTIWREGCTAAGTMTVSAIAGRAGIVEPGAADEGCGGMTEMAIQRGRNVFVMLTRCGYTVAGRAIVHDTGMIKHRTDESTGVMTDTAILVC
jgi:hypothetical protein